MKFKKNTFKLLISLIIALMLFANFAYAENTADESGISLISSTDETMPIVDSEVDDIDSSNSTSQSIRNGDLFAIEDSITIDYPLSGNVYIIAQEVNIDNVIDGNVFILANTVNIKSNSYIYSDAYIVANTITIDGYIYDLYSFSNSLSISNTGYIIRDLSSSCTTFSLSGIINRTANLSAKNINISEEGSKIGGDLNYSSPQAISIANDVVSGNINFTQTETTDSTDATESLLFDYIANVLSTLFYALIVILIIVFALNSIPSKFEAKLTTKFWSTFGFGLLTIIIVPVISIMLFFTGFGIWIGLLLLFAYIFIFTITTPISAIALSKYISTKSNKTSNWFLVLISTLLVLAVWICKQLPIIGSLVSLVVNSLGFGLIITSLLKNKTSKKENSSNSEKTE